MQTTIELPKTQSTNQITVPITWHSTHCKSWIIWIQSCNEKRLFLELNFNSVSFSIIISNLIPVLSHAMTRPPIMDASYFSPNISPPTLFLVSKIKCFRNRYLALRQLTEFQMKNYWIENLRVPSPTHHEAKTRTTKLTIPETHVYKSSIFVNESIYIYCACDNEIEPSQLFEIR